MAGPLAFAGGRSKPDAKLVAKVRGWGEAEMTAQVRAAPRHGATVCSFCPVRRPRPVQNSWALMTTPTVRAASHQLTPHACCCTHAPPGGVHLVAAASEEDDGGDSDGVAGVTLNNGASVRLVPAEGAELTVSSHEEELERTSHKNDSWVLERTQNQPLAHLVVPTTIPLET